MSRELESNQLRDYVRQIKDLESSCHSQDETITKVQADFNDYKNAKPEKRIINAPELKTVSKPAKPIEPAEPNRKLLHRAILFFLLSALVIVIFIKIWDQLGFKYNYLEGFEKILLKNLPWVVIIISGFLGFKYLIDWIRERTRYNNDMPHYKLLLSAYEEYPSKKAQAIEEYEAELADYNRFIKENDDEFAENIKNYQNTCSESEQVINELQTVYDSTKNTLKRLYDFDVVFPKYRSFVAMATISEYLESGRCTTLTGPDGAYNLYESELRQNRVISRLDTIAEQIELVKDNQYLLYTELKKANQISEHIATEVRNLADVSHRIAVHSAITARCSEITATNTKAIAMIEALEFMGI